MMSFLNRIFGDANQKELKRLQPLVDQINRLEVEFEKLKTGDFSKKTEEFKTRLKSGETLDDLLPEAYALVREAAKRAIGQRHYDVQLLAGIVLHQGKIAEQRTGEGKTLSATLPLYLNALEGRGAHLVTVNDFLAKFQAQWMGKIFHYLGLTCAAIGHEASFIYTPRQKRPVETDEFYDGTWQNLQPVSRKEAYQADITYGTNNEFGFDYLRDNMAVDLRQLVQRPLHFAIVDEVDSILIDEARTPLIISAPAEQSAGDYQRFSQIVKALKPEQDFTLDEKSRTVSILDEGIKKVEQALGIKNLYAAENLRLVHHLEEALKAQFLFKRNKDYVVKDGEIVIVDEFTGRLMPGRRYSEGLHQAIEAKEGVKIQRESDTLATISFQNFFRLYDKLAGMTGTAATEAEEFYKIYRLDVVVIPTHRPMIRIDNQDKIYQTAEVKYQAIVQEVKRRFEKGQPVLIGTISIQKNEYLSRLLKRAGIPHKVLNAKKHQQEARIIAQAGRIKAVTLATNIAGRGVDIILGGTPPVDEKTEETQGLQRISQDKRTFKEWEKEHQAVIKLGGLFVLGTERHEARRIDNQLRGRSGRQGDPGESQFFVSMEDDLMRIFGGSRLKKMMERLGLPKDMPIEHKMISRSIESAQKKVEGYNFDLRKHLVEYDDIANRQREIIYKKRRQILELKGKNSQGELVHLHEEILDLMPADKVKEFQDKFRPLATSDLYELEKQIYLKVIDSFWVEHLNSMDHLRTGIGLRGYEQKDPLVEYKKTAYFLFKNLLKNIEAEVVNVLLKLELQPISRPASVQPVGRLKTTAEHSTENFQTASAYQAAMRNKTGQQKQDGQAADEGVSITVRQRKREDVLSQTTIKPSGQKKIGRNDPCPCGSGKKYKKCCGR